MIRNSDVFLPVSFNRQSAWPGHRPGTRGRLRAILDKAALRTGGLSIAERALLAACDFWSAVATQSLEWHLGSHPELRLRSVATIYLAIGAKRAARAMEATVVELLHARNETHRQQRIAALEVVMIKARDSAEEKISRFAVRLLPQALESVRRPAMVVTAPTVAVAVAPRRVNTGPRVRLPVTDVRRPASSYVRWRTENLSAGQHD